MQQNNFTDFFKAGALKPQSSFMQKAISLALDKHTVILSNWVEDYVTGEVANDELRDSAVTCAIEDRNVRCVEIKDSYVVLIDNETLNDVIDIDNTLQSEGWDYTYSDGVWVIRHEDGRHVNIIADPDDYVAVVNSEELDIQGVSFNDADRYSYCEFDDAGMLEAAGIDVDDHMPEVLQWFMVDDWLARKLRNVGEVVIEELETRDTFITGTFWGRTCYGQSITIDYCMYEAFKDEISTNLRLHNTGVLCIPISSLSDADAALIAFERLDNRILTTESWLVTKVTPRLAEFISAVSATRQAYCFTKDVSLVSTELWSNIDLKGESEGAGNN